VQEDLTGFLKETYQFGDTGPRPVEYFRSLKNYEDHDHNDRSCEEWRLTAWNTSTGFPDHEVKELKTQPFLIGIGPPRSASSNTFNTLATNPKICYHRTNDDVDFSESREVFKNVTDSAKVDEELLQHFAPKNCCEANVMKSPYWAISRVAPLQLARIFKDNPKAKFILTIREPISGSESLLNHYSTTEKFLSNVPANIYFDLVHKNSYEEDVCAQDMWNHGKYPDKDLKAAEYYDKNCMKAYSLQRYNYPAIFKRYADLIGADNIYCQFIGDLRAGKADSIRREQLDLIGLNHIDETDFFMRTMPRHGSYYKSFSIHERATLKVQYTEMFGAYSEKQMRSMCVHQS